MLIPVIAIIMGVGIAAIAILAGHKRDVSEMEFRHRERMAAIEKGLELPPEPERSDPRKVARSGGGQRYLLRGMIWLGIGLAVALIDDGIGRYHSYGWIAAAIGAAYLIYYLIEGRHMPPPGSPPGGTPPGQGGGAPSA